MQYKEYAWVYAIHMLSFMLAVGSAPDSEFLSSMVMVSFFSSEHGRTTDMGWYGTVGPRIRLLSPLAGGTRAAEQQQQSITETRFQVTGSHRCLYRVGLMES